MTSIAVATNFNSSISIAWLNCPNSRSNRVLSRVLCRFIPDDCNCLDVLSSIIKQLGGGRSAQLPRNISIAIDRTIGYLQKHRCLLILDDAEAVLNHDPRDSTHPSIQDYLQSIERVNLVQHRSCCLIILEQNFSSPNYSYRQLELGRLAIGSENPRQL